MNIQQIENRFSLIANAMSLVGDEDTRKCVAETKYILAEIRHYCHIIKNIPEEDHPEFHRLFMFSLFNRYGAK